MLSKNRDEPCVYRKASESDVVFLILYVDDILIMGNNIPRLKEVKDYLGKCFSVKDLGEAAYILGIKIYRDRSLRLIGLNQSAYIPINNIKESSVPYASAVGSIMYADPRVTRPDVAFAQNLVSRYQQNPGKLHWVAVKHILKYLRNTKDSRYLVYGEIQIRTLMLQVARTFSMRKYHYAREQVESGEIKLIKVHNREKSKLIAYTKALPRGKVNEQANCQPAKIEEPISAKKSEENEEKLTTMWLRKSKTQARTNPA
ncbi:retrotransposon protein, putative, ty1-copia subclass [Tanacetum coccineum]